MRQGQAGDSPEGHRSKVRILRVEIKADEEKVKASTKYKNKNDRVILKIYHNNFLYR